DRWEPPSSPHRFLPRVPRAVGRDMLGSVTAGTLAPFLCKFSGPRNTYIHWYHQQPGKAPHRLLYCNVGTSKAWLESGFHSDKFLTYKFVDHTCTLKIQNLKKSDAGTYYCASWDSTMTQVPLPFIQKIIISGHQEQALPPQQIWHPILLPASVFLAN
uniref:Ig-like domain-containing protein n=1 Tax=Ornithorhynchus anatinus TaxID=9258 RepID=K7EHZ3_ORNAN